MLKDIKDDPDRGMFCLEWKDDDPYEVQGYFMDDFYTRLEVNLVPCNYIHTMMSYEGDTVS